MIPGLENAEFIRYGVMHRNTYINSPELLNHAFQLKKEPRLFFAGQMTGVEGYLESAASGLMVGLQVERYLEERSLLISLKLRRSAPLATIFLTTKGLTSNR